MTDFTPNQAMLNNYIQNKLSDTDTEQLELWLVDHPDVRQDLEMGVMFKQADLDASIFLEKTKKQKTNWLEKLLPKPALVFSHAAVFAFGMFLFNLIVDDKTVGISNPNVVMFNQVRGDNENITISNFKDLLIQIPVEYLSKDLYKIEISGSGSFHYKADKLKPDADIVSLLVPKQLLVTGQYKLTIVNNNSDDQSVYGFEINGQ